LIDYGDVVSFPGHTEDMIAAVEESVSRLVDSNVASLGLGGDHLTSYPALKAFAKKHGPLSLIHFDAHPDLVEAPHLFHGSMFGVAVRENLIDPDTSIQIGIRTPSPPSPKLQVLTADRCLRMHGEAIADKIKDVVGSRKCYVTLDVDAMDPAHTSGTGTPAPGGLTSALQREILWHLKGVNAVGGDVVEVSPPYDEAAKTAIVGAIVAMDILYILGEARNTR
jgi:agmatinase